MTNPRLARDTERGGLLPRFRVSYTVQPSGCWTWTGRINRDGYGRFSIKSRWHMAHRVAHELLIGAIPDGFEVDHLCHNGDTECAGGTTCAHRLCVNPLHLEAVSHRTNMHRTAYIAAKVQQTHCKHGHEYTAANTHRDIRGNRRCRACVREQKAASRKARRGTA
ncbi:HNH endonuclease [Streptomyces goshikiensis]|uniref:HNH endonuclease n=1 Tax=Streptomyces goshikiensis TaxID=1942 RepID=UPI0036BDE39D